MKTMVILSLIIVTMAGAIGCAPDTSSTTLPAQGNLSIPAGDRTPTPGVYMIPSDTIYFAEIPDIISQSGSSVEVKLTFTNYDSETRIMSEFPPRIDIESRNLPSTNNTIRSFQAGQEQLELRPRESKNYVLTWDQKNDSGQQVPYGWYGIRVNIYSREITDTRSMQGSEGQATRVLVLPPGGVMEKDIELSQSQVANGITVNLEKMEMNIHGAALYIMCIPENYEPQEELTRVTGTDAEYRVDDEDWKPAIKSEFGTFLLEDGVRYIWDLDPVPQNAREISFQIKRIGDRQGPWEFVIPLDDELPFQINVSTAPAYLPGEQIMFGIGIANLSSGTITIDSFSPAMWIKLVGQDKAVYSSPSGTRTYDIQADQPFLPNKNIWDQKDNDGHQVSPGWYEIGYEYVIIEQSTGKRYAANPTATFQIVNPDSAMNKNLDVNQSVTSAGTTMTLQRLELNAASGTATIFYSPSGFSLPEGQDPNQVEKLGNYVRDSTAEYSVDGGNIKQLTNTSSMFDKSGVTLYWHNIDPVPTDAKEFMFTVTRLGGQEGHWEFTIQLEQAFYVIRKGAFWSIRVIDMDEK